MKKQKVFIVIPCPTTLRNIMTSPRGVCRQLQAAGIEVVILTPDYAQQIIAQEFDIAVLPLIRQSRTKLESVSDFITKHLNMTNMQILASKYGLRPSALKKKRRSWLHLVRLAVAATLGKWEWFRVTGAGRLHLWAYKRRPCREYFSEHQPDLLFVPNIGNDYSEEVLREAKRCGVATIGMVGSWDHPHKRFQPLQTDIVYAWSEVVKNELVQLQSYPAENVRVVGAAQYDMYVDKEFVPSKEDFFAEIGFTVNNPTIAFFSATGRAPHEGDLIDMVLKWRENGDLPHNLQIYIRTYPGDEEGDRKKYDAFARLPGVFIEWFTDTKAFGPWPINFWPGIPFMKRVVSLYNHCDVFVSVYSSVTAEASVLLKQSVNINFDGYMTLPYEESVRRFELISHFDKMFATGGVTNINSAEDFLSAIKRSLANPNYNQDNIKKIQEVVCGVIDGQSALRMVDGIIDKLNNSMSK